MLNEKEHKEIIEIARVSIDQYLKYRVTNVTDTTLAKILNVLIQESGYSTTSFDDYITHHIENLSYDDQYNMTLTTLLEILSFFNLKLSVTPINTDK